MIVEWDMSARKKRTYVGTCPVCRRTLGAREEGGRFVMVSHARSPGEVCGGSGSPAISVIELDE